MIEKPDPPVGEPTTGLDHPRQWAITIPAPAKFINANDRLHWAPKAKLTRTWRQAAHVYARQAKLPQGLDRVRIVAEVVKPTARVYDAHNLVPTLKAVVDGLVDYGLILDDTNAHLVGPDVRQGGKGPAALVLFVTEIVSTGHTRNRC